MSDFQKELLNEIIEDNWNLADIDAYIDKLVVRSLELNDWIKHVKAIKKKRTKSKSTPENGPRDGR
jgi:hypothetical protein